jgi:hypothetical protein
MRVHLASSLHYKYAGRHKRMGSFQKLLSNPFLTLHGHNIHCQQRALSRFLMRYYQFTPYAYCGPRDQFARWQTAVECKTIHLNDKMVYC